MHGRHVDYQARLPTCIHGCAREDLERLGEEGELVEGPVAKKNTAYYLVATH